MEPEGLLPHSQVPPPVPILSQAIIKFYVIHNPCMNQFYAAGEASNGYKIWYLWTDSDTHNNVIKM